MFVEIGHQAERSWQIGTTIAHLLAIGATCLRLYIRAEKSRFWWDDMLISATALIDAFFLVTIWTKQAGYVFDERGFAQNAWYICLPCYLVLWLSRISSWLSLARVYPPKHFARQTAFRLCGAYLMLCLACISMGILGCEDSAWGTRQRPELCYHTGDTGGKTRYEKFMLVIAIIDIVTDFALIVIPACLLSDTRLPRKEKTLIIFLGSGSFLTLISVAILTFVLYGPFVHNVDWNIVVDGTVHLTGYVALVAANTVVIGTATYRFLERWKTQRHLRRSDTTSGPTRSTNLTPITDSWRSGSDLLSTFGTPSPHQLDIKTLPIDAETKSHGDLFHRMTV